MTTTDSPTSVRLPAPLRLQVTTLAVGQRRTFSQMLTLLVEEGLRTLGETDGKGGVALADGQEMPPMRATSVSPSVRDTALTEREVGSGNAPVTTMGSASSKKEPAASRSVSAGKGTREAARRSDPCPHRVRAGAYCKRCEKVV